MFASRAVAAATLTVRQVSRAGAPVRGVDDVVHRAPAVAPAADGGARGGQAAGADRDRLAGAVGVAAVVVGDT